MWECLGIENAMKIVCKFCSKQFLKESTRNSHMLFFHNFYMPMCSTGIAEKQYMTGLMYVRRQKESQDSYHGRLRGNTHHNSKYMNVPVFFKNIKKII